MRTSLAPTHLQQSFAQHVYLVLQLVVDLLEDLDMRNALMR